MAASVRILAAPRIPSGSVSRGCAPGWGRSLQMITRMPLGQPDNSSRSVTSVTQAPSRDLAVAVIGRCPRPGGDQPQSGGEGLRQAEPDRVGPPAPDQPGQQRIDGAGAIDAD
jgi:hypothetical protein